jgi:hypothetical protein
MKFLPGFTPQRGKNVCGDKVSLLQGNRRNAVERPAGLMGKMRLIPRNKNFRIMFQAQVRLNNDSTMESSSPSSCRLRMDALYRRPKVPWLPRFFQNRCRHHPHQFLSPFLMSEPEHPSFPNDDLRVEKASPKNWIKYGDRLRWG